MKDFPPHLSRTRRLIVTKDLQTSSPSVYDFEADLDLSSELAVKVSDHYPVEMEVCVVCVM